MGHPVQYLLLENIATDTTLPDVSKTYTISEFRIVCNELLTRTTLYTQPSEVIRTVDEIISFRTQFQKQLAARPTGNKTPRPLSIIKIRPVGSKTAKNNNLHQSCTFFVIFPEPLDPNSYLTQWDGNEEAGFLNFVWKV